MEEPINPFKLQQQEDKRRRAETKQQQEAEAERRAEEKKKERARTNQAAEDSWYFDGTPDKFREDEDHEDFQMLDLTAAPSQTPSGLPQKAATITSLIDFDECNSSSPLKPREVISTSSPIDASSVRAEEPLLSSYGGDADLLSEIQHLQQRLKDAEEERHIQVAIAQEEASHLRQELHNVTSERDSLRVQLEAIQSQAPAATGVSVALCGAGAMHHNVAVEALREVRISAEKQVEWIRQRLSLDAK